jgi:hypothetical protein
MNYMPRWSLANRVRNDFGESRISRLGFCSAQETQNAQTAEPLGTV